MHYATFLRRSAWIVCVCWILVSGCTLKASTESLTDATTNFLSSTTPGEWYTADGQLKPDQKVTAFVAISYESLQQEMAQGRGEYVTALGKLLNIPDQNMSYFHTLLQEGFQHIHTTLDHRPESFLTMFSKVRDQANAR